jgi:glycosyltransferase involved in cell wall biosynthesis
VSDGSTDNTLKILKKFEEKDERIHIITQENLGAGNARNVGMKASKGEYIIFLDSDDIFNETMLEELYAQIKGNNLEIVICNSQNFYIFNNKTIFYKKNYSFSKKR